MTYRITSSFHLWIEGRAKLWRSSAAHGIMAEDDKTMRYAIGDIHGGSKTFWALLERIGLRHGDLVFLLGDYVDRGNDSEGVLDALIGLMESGYDLRPVRGNHDDMMLRCITDDHDMYSSVWMETWGKRTLASFGVEHPGLLPERYRALLQSMPYLRQEEDFVFVHAGLDMKVEDPLTQSDPKGMIWGDVLRVDPVKLGGRKLISGHIIRPLALIEESLSTGRIYLDNGAFTGLRPDMGNLVALNLDEMSLTVQPWLDGRAEA